MTPTSTRVKHLPAGGGRALAMIGDSVTFKAEPDEGGEVLLFEHYLPAGLGVPPHRESAYEAFYVIEGTLEIEADGQGYRLGPGEYLGVQPWVVHALRNPGPGAMRALTFISPGANHARFFTTLGRPIADPYNPPPLSGPPDVARLAAVARDCGIEFLPPKS